MHSEWPEKQNGCVEAMGEWVLRMTMGCHGLLLRALEVGQRCRSIAWVGDFLWILFILMYIHVVYIYIYINIIYIYVCDIYIYVWTICRDVKLLTMWFSDLPRSCHYDLHGAVAHSWVHCQWSYSWVGRISGLIIPAYLQRSSFLDMGRGQPKNHLAEQFAILLHWLFHVRYVRCRNLGLVSTIFSKKMTSTTLAMAMVAFWYFYGPFHRPIPVKCNWIVFARKMHSTTEFAMTALSKCARCVHIYMYIHI